MPTVGLVLCNFNTIYVLSLGWVLSLIQVTSPVPDKGFREHDQLLPLLSNGSILVSGDCCLKSYSEK